MHWRRSRDELLLDLKYWALAGGFFSSYFFARWFKNRLSSDSGSHDLVLQTRMEKLNYHLRLKVLLAKTYIESLPTLPPPRCVATQESEKKKHEAKQKTLSLAIKQSSSSSSRQEDNEGSQGMIPPLSPVTIRPCTLLLTLSCQKYITEDKNTLQDSFHPECPVKNASMCFWIPTAQVFVLFCLFSVDWWQMATARK